jgi:hypothetical protein
MTILGSVLKQQSTASINNHSTRYLMESPVLREHHHQNNIDGWFQFDYVLDLTEGTEKHYIVIG